SSHPDMVTEAKLRPKRQEILEWLDRVELGTKQTKERVFELSYGRGAGALLGTIERLCRIATEANGDSEIFSRLVNLERTADFDLVLAHLKTDPHRSLLRVRMNPFDPGSLRRDLQFRLRHLVRE